MKNLFMASLVMCGALLATSCGDSAAFTEGAAESAVNEMISPMTKNFTYGEVKVGYYELNSEADRYQLRKLQAAGVINYSAAKILEQKGSYYYSWNEEHVFVTVSLTEEGKKYQLTQEQIEEIDEAMAAVGVDEDLQFDASGEEYPENGVSPEETFPGDKAPAGGSSSGSQASKSQATQATASKVTADMSEYERAKAREKSELCYVQLYKLDLDKVRNLRCTDDMAKDGRATCEAIFRFVDVTPFGRIIGDVHEGQPQAQKCSFTYFNDKGWVVNMDIE